MLTWENQYIFLFYQVLPYTIDANFEKKKKQPKVVTNKGLHVDFQSELVSEHFFR